MFEAVLGGHQGVSTTDRQYKATFAPRDPGITGQDSHMLWVMHASEIDVYRLMQRP
jgi:hypothetical protein